MKELVEVLHTINLTEGEDKWSWTIDSSGEFSVNSTYSFVSEMLVERVNLSKEQIVAFKSNLEVPYIFQSSGVRVVSFKRQNSD
jgi:hypothetical protein